MNNIENIELINEKECEITIKKNNEIIKYKLSLTNPKLIDCLNRFINMQNKKLELRKADIESDCLGQKIKNGLIISAVSLPLLLLMAFIISTAPEIIGMFAYLGFIGISASSFLIYKNIQYEKKPEKVAIVTKLEKEINTLRMIRKKAIESSHQKFIEETKKKENEQELKKIDHQRKMLEEAKKKLELRKLANIHSTKLQPHELNYLDSIIEKIRCIEGYNKMNFFDIRKMINNLFLAKKEENHNRNNLDILKEIADEINSSSKRR